MRNHSLFGLRGLIFIIFCLVLTVSVSESAMAQGCRQDVAYESEQTEAGATIYLTLNDASKNYTIVLFATSNGVQELDRRDLRLSRGERTSVFESIQAGHYVIQLVDDSGCHFVVNGMEGVEVELNR